jgi:hypothetical protein
LEEHLALLRFKTGDIVDDKKWADFYCSDVDNVMRIFIKVMTTDGQHFFFHEYDDWYKVKEYCQKNLVFIKDLDLQFRSSRYTIDTTDCEGIYLVRSVLGSIGQPTKNYYTVGLLKEDGLVYKQMWLVPELILEQEYVDDTSSCFMEAMIYNDKKKANV